MKKAASMKRPFSMLSQRLCDSVRMVNRYRIPQNVRDLIKHGKRRRITIAGARLSEHFDGDMVRAVAKIAQDAPHHRQLLAPATIYQGAMHSEAARIGKVILQFVLAQVLPFNTCRPWLV
jgi:hypothetical protein